MAGRSLLVLSPRKRWCFCGDSCLTQIPSLVTGTVSLVSGGWVEETRGQVYICEFLLWAREARGTAPVLHVLWGNGKDSPSLWAFATELQPVRGVTANLCVSTWSGCGSLNLQEAVLPSSVWFFLHAAGILEVAGMCCVGLGRVLHGQLHVKAASMSVLDVGLTQDGLMGTTLF